MRCKKKPASIVRKIKHFLPALRRVWTAVIMNITPLTFSAVTSSLIMRWSKTIRPTAVVTSSKQSLHITISM